MKKELGIFILLVVLCGVVSFMNPRFLSASNLQNMARLIGMYGIFSIGLGLVIITSGIDLSVGSVFALQGVLLSMMLADGKWDQKLASPLLAIVNPICNFFAITNSPGVALGISGILIAIFVIAATSLLGLVHGLLITRVKMQPFIVTLCGLLFYRGIARYIAHDETKGFGNDGFGVLRDLAAGSMTIPTRFELWVLGLTIVIFILWLIIRYLVMRKPFLSPWKIATLGLLVLLFAVTEFMYLFDIQFFVPMPFVLLIAISAIMWVVLHRSVYGRYLFAVGRNEDAARYSGVNTKLVVTSAYVLCSALAGVAGIVIAFYTNSVSPSGHGNFYELYGIAAAVLGGCSLRGGEGSIIGIIIGTALLQVLQNLVNLLGIDSSLNFAVMGAVILAGVLVDQLLRQRKRKTPAVPASSVPAMMPAK